MVLLTHAPILYNQLISQCKKMRIDHSKQEQEEMEEDDATTEVSIDHERNQEIIEEMEREQRKSRCICWKNFRNLWHF